MSARPANYGGQAVIEGVMIRGRRTIALACRKPDGGIYRYREPLRSPLVRSRVARLPFVRGVVVLWESLDYGIRMLMRSAEVQLEEDDQLGKGGNTLIMGVALVGALLLFIGVPYLATSAARALIPSSIVLNVTEGLIRLALLIGYLSALENSHEVWVQKTVGCDWWTERSQPVMPRESPTPYSPPWKWWPMTITSPVSCV